MVILHKNEYDHFGNLFKFATSNMSKNKKPIVKKTAKCIVAVFKQACEILLYNGQSKLGHHAVDGFNIQGVIDS